MYDVAIIGAGVVGAMVARTLAKYNIKVCILEKENDVATGATKANSAIVHAGFDAKTGTFKAKLNVQGSQMMEQVAKELGVSYKNNGSLVIGFNEEDEKTIEQLYQRGVENGVKGLEIVDKQQLKLIEPGLSDNVTCALYAATGAIVCPYELTIAAIGNAMDNGVELLRDFEVSCIQKVKQGFEISSNEQSIIANYVVNAAGVYSDKIAAMVGDNSFSIAPRKGEYILLDKECGKIVSHTIFRTPSKMGKGILVTPTVDGNLILGPTSVDIEDKTDVSTTVEGFEKIIKESCENVKKIPFGKAITSFCGLRATGSTGDFVINSPLNGFINVAAIESPGLSASPAIAVMVRDMLMESGLEMPYKQNYNPGRKSMHYFRQLTIEQKNEIIEKDKSFGKIVCRCEGVTEGEIIEAIHTNPKPCDVDGVKRRTRAQMGRCQGGFCTPYIMELLARELNIPMEQITKNGGNSMIVVDKTKEEI